MEESYPIPTLYSRRDINATSFGVVAFVAALSLGLSCLAFIALDGRPEHLVSFGLSSGVVSLSLGGLAGLAWFARCLYALAEFEVDEKYQRAELELKYGAASEWLKGLTPADRLAWEREQRQLRAARRLDKHRRKIEELQLEQQHDEAMARLKATRAGSPSSEEWEKLQGVLRHLDGLLQAGVRKADPGPRYELVVLFDRRSPYTPQRIEELAGIGDACQEAGKRLVRLLWESNDRDMLESAEASLHDHVGSAIADSWITDRCPEPEPDLAGHID